MNNDRDGARWRLLCKAVASGGKEAAAIEALLNSAPKIGSGAELVAVMTVILDEVLEMHPEVQN